MSISASCRSSLIAQFQRHLKTENYSKAVQKQYPPLARCFLDYCEREQLTLDVVYPEHLTNFLQEQYQLFQQRRSASPAFQKWCWRYSAPIHMLLRMVRGTWPIDSPPSTTLEAFHRDIVNCYDTWLRDQRGLSPLTRAKRTKQAIHFLTWLGQRADHEHIELLCVSDVDTYLQECCRGLRRVSIEGVTVCLRDTLRHLHYSGHIPNDLSSTVIGPRIYDHENIPSALSAEQVRRVLEVSLKDRSPIGLRDFAILILLATYGLRAAEIVRLRLEDIDWQRDVVRVHHGKTDAFSELPLLHEPGEALLRYLQKARPTSTHREIFLRINAPYSPFKSGSSLNCITGSRLKASGVKPAGRHGPHAFRHARAVSLLRSGIPLNVIGNVLGHTSASSTNVYLKLAVEDLRTIGLELPSGVSP